MLQNFFATRSDLVARDPSNPQNKASLKKCVEDDLKRFKG
jgi:hypothetical protein